MKRFSKILLATLLVLCLTVTTFAFTGVFSHAESMQEGVYVVFTGTDTTGQLENDWVTVDANGVIQDKTLKFVVHNETPDKYADDETKANKPIIITGYETNGDLTLNGDTENQRVINEASIDISSGTATPGQILWVKVTYYVEGNLSSLTETCTARIFVTTGEDFYTQVPANNYNVKIEKNGVSSYQFNCNGYAAPITAEDTDAHYESSATRTGEKTMPKDFNLFKPETWVHPGEPVDQSCTDQNIFYTIRLDVSRYSEWKQFGLKFHYQGGDVREHMSVAGVDMTQYNTASGSMSMLEIASSPGTPHAAKEFTNDDPTPYCKTDITEGNSEWRELAFDGNVPSECVSDPANAPRFRAGCGVLGVADADISGGTVQRKTAVAYFFFNFTILGVDKSDLRSDLLKYAREGKNQASYEANSWNAYVTELDKAYEMMADTGCTVEQLAAQRSTLKTKHDNLKRLAVVYTNHYYYEGIDASNPVLFATDLKRDQENSDAEDDDGEYHITSERQINRAAASNNESVTVAVTADTNYTMTVNLYYWYVDTEPLQELIDYYDENFSNDALVKKQYDTEGNLIYTTNSWNKYVNAINTYRNYLTKTDLFEYDYRLATNAITTAFKGLKYDNPTTPWLDEGVAWATQIKASKTITDIDELESVFIDNGNRGFDWRYSTIFGSKHARELYSAMDEALTEAKTLKEGNYTKAQAQEATDNLWNAIEALQIKDPMGLYKDGVGHADKAYYGWIINPSDPSQNRNAKDFGLSMLYEAIVNRAASVQIDKGNGEYMSFSELKPENFTEESWKDLLDAMYGQRELWEDDYEEYFADLASFDAVEFYSEIGVACKVAESYPAGETVTLMDEEGELVVGTSLDIPAYPMIHNIWFLASQQNYNACRDNLLEKIRNLVWAVDTDELQEAYDEAQDVDYDLYTNASGKVLKDALATAKAKLDAVDAGDQLFGDDNAVTQEVINDQIDIIAAAVMGLNLKPTMEAENPNEIELDDTCISGTDAGTTGAQLMEQLKFNNFSADAEKKILDKDDNEIALDAQLATGDRVVLRSVAVDEEGQHEIYQEAVVIVKGDVGGDALIGEDDVQLVFNYAFTKSGIQDAESNCYMKAADFNNDNKVNLTDAVLINFMLHGHNFN